MLRLSTQPPFAQAPVECGRLLHSQRTSFRKASVQRPNGLRQAAVSSSEQVASFARIVPKVSLGGLAIAGATLGPLLDGIHGTVHLLEYKVSHCATAFLRLSYAKAACSSTNIERSYSSTCLPLCDRLDAMVSERMKWKLLPHGAKISKYDR